MGVGLMPLEFTDCLTDSPSFRENLQKHEKELDKTSQQIKRLIKEVKDLLQAAKRLSGAQLTLAASLEQFEFECIGQSLTEDELVISKSLAQFAQLIKTIEDERERMLGRAYEQIIQPLEKFRKDHIGAVKEGKKKFDKKTAKFCQSQERNLNLSTKKQDNVFQEADALMDMANRDFCQASLEYVFLLQEVQERKKFEFVEILLGFMFGWLTFYHQGHEVHHDFKPYMSDLQLRIQKTRSNFEETSKKTELLMKKMMEMRQTIRDEPGRPFGAGFTRAGYLFLMEKKAFGTTWSKQYCTYEKSTKEFTMTPFNQITVKMTSVPDVMVLTSCVRRMSETIDKRFCFDVTAEGRLGMIYTLQALSEDDRKAWLDAMDGKEPTYEHQCKVTKTEERPLDDVGFTFVQRCIEVLESRGLEEQGLYRVTGVASKVNKLLSMGLDRRKGLPLTLDDQYEWESKTITSALKTYLRTLPEPLMTHRFHNGFIAAAKQDIRQNRVLDVHTLIHRLPKPNFEMLEIVIKHLKNVVQKSDKNLMNVSNLAVCFGPTLLRPEEETVASIMDLKFYNVVVEILIDNYEKIFHSQPDMSEKGSNGAVIGGIRTPPPGAPAPAQQPSPPQRAAQRPSQPVTHAVIKAYYDGPLSTGGGANRANARTSITNLTQGPSPRSETNLHHLAHHNRGYSPPPLSVQQQMRPSHQQQAQRFSAHQHQIMQQFGGSSQALGLHSTEIHRDTLLNSTSSSNESVSSISSRDLIAPSTLSSLPSMAANHSHGSPVKSRRMLANSHHGPATYYATSYRPQAQHNGSIVDGHRAAQEIGQPQYGAQASTYAVRMSRESDGELSFEPNQIITNVKSSAEPGWLEGTLNGKTGLVPENYVEALP